MVEKEFNVLTHDLVPEHVILKEEEIREILKKFNIIPEQLPKILSKDPAAKSIDADEGDVIKITRKSPTAGVTTYYRLVVKK